MEAILKDIAKRNSIEISSMEVMPDHIHMMISFAPKLTPSSIVKALKGGSAKQWFAQYPETKQQLWGGRLWSPSFFMSTLGNTSKEVVSKYINSQLKHYNGGRPRRWFTSSLKERVFSTGAAQKFRAKNTTPLLPVRIAEGGLCLVVAMDYQYLLHLYYSQN